MIRCVHAGGDLVTFIVIAIIIGIIRAARKAATSSGGNAPVSRQSTGTGGQDDLEQFLKSIGAATRTTVQQPPPLPRQKLPPPAPQQAAPHRKLALRWEDTPIVRALASRMGGKHATAAAQQAPVADSSRERMKARQKAEEQATGMQANAPASVFRGADAHLPALPSLPLGASMPIMSLLEPVQDPLSITHEDGGADDSKAAPAFVLPDLTNPQTLRGAILAREVLGGAVALRKPSVSSPAGPIS